MASLSRDKRVEVAAFSSLILVLVLGVCSFWFSIPAVVWIVLLVTSAVAHGLRLALWKPLQTYRNPLLWMLPVAYAWIPIALVLRAMAQLALVPPAAAIHALTIGAMSSLMVAMMTRSSLGHTGRLLKAGPAELTVFLLLQATAVVRVFAGLILPGHYQSAMMLAGALWLLAFGVFVLRYWPILTRKRIDGRPG